MASFDCSDAASTLFCGGRGRQEAATEGEEIYFCGDSRASVAAASAASAASVASAVAAAAADIGVSNGVCCLLLFSPFPSTLSTRALHADEEIPVPPISQRLKEEGDCCRIGAL